MDKVFGWAVIYVCICIHTCKLYLHTYIHVCVLIYLLVHMHTYITTYLHTYRYIYVYMRVFIHIYTRASKYISIHVCIYMGGCQHYGPLLGPLNTRCCTILRTKHGTKILTKHPSLYLYLFLLSIPISISPFKEPVEGNLGLSSERLRRTLPGSLGEPKALGRFQSIHKYIHIYIYM